MFGGERVKSKGEFDMKKMILMVVAAALSLGSNALAQESRSEISLQGTGLFTKDTTGRGTLQRGTDTGGLLVGYRYHINRWLAAEAVYGYARNSQEFFAPASISHIQANVHQATGGFVVISPTTAKFRVHPYVLAEGGALVFVPT